MLQAKSWKLSIAQRHEIARRYAAGETGANLATEFGVTPGNVSKIAKARGKRSPRRAGRPRVKRPTTKPELWHQKIARLRAAGKLTEFFFRITV